jgi:NADH:ubiquinone oxidoreductase subunit E
MIEDRVRIVICTGTTCYVMGGANLLGLEDELPDELRDRVAVEGSPCLDLCKGGRYGKAPFALVGDRVLCEATVPKILEELRRRIPDERPL